MPERVYTVTNYYDGLRQGVADFHGKPHFYDSQFSDIDSETPDSFLLTPIDSATFDLVLEDWEIWRRWEAAFNRGETDLSTHPALPGDATRHRKIEQSLAPRLKTDPQLAILAHAEFQLDDERPIAKGIRNFLVDWTLINNKG